MSAQWIHILSRNIRNNAPELLAGAAIAGLVTTVYLAVKATPEAKELIDEAQLGVDENLPLTAKEKVTVAWKPYLPAFITGTATIGAIVGSVHIGARRTAVAIGAYTLADTAFREYKEKVLEELTPAKARKVEDAVNTERVRANPPENNTIIFTGQGEVVCLETMTGRYFKSNPEKIRQEVNEFNAILLQDAYGNLPLNAWFDQLGLPATSLGNELGFNIDNRLSIIFTSALSECDQPVLALGYASLPVRDYDKL